MKIKKLNSVDKVFIVCLISFICKISYNLYIKDYRKIVFSAYCMIIPVVIFLYYKFKFNSKEDVELLQVSKSLSIKLILKSLLKQIPGFRTSDRVNMIIGSIYYIAWILFVIIGITIGNVKGVYTGVSALFFPYIIFNYLNVISKE
ncbi:hypothetical protein [Clostridium saccharobutylicum]|uniref:Uncharacterized protein n=1 Tax=Clostridium saccharobutylicum DSM 13864 TaxID=1345695 RepID=U5MXR3_CLOSA|nr:hypothetical protein [Clostridium saccharobutylicum]AGX44386.1 hypothetical protein CLSA_c34230 [Clostridium saccharobutylicum DSM 13864]AQR91678.1 hypothetical protein CLOSC_34040 [Clostridium saccharobutylicum]AQS01582.1 hypothetical protein CSACC_34110 [Clostridium saccharobutylicum]AQS11192.1 hypothetical protein CLOBY_33460 [Clostridium saccharobutylicum]AQS15565.1 hypothetical protein CLOSACC_34110 [Clostridium saccharobutylicum]